MGDKDTKPATDEQIAKLAFWLDGNALGAVIWKDVVAELIARIEAETARADKAEGMIVRAAPDIEAMSKRIAQLEQRLADAEALLNGAMEGLRIGDQGGALRASIEEWLCAKGK